MLLPFASWNLDNVSTSVLISQTVPACWTPLVQSLLETFETELKLNNFIYGNLRTAYLSW